MKVKISNPSVDMVRLLNALTLAWALNKDLTWCEHEDEEGTWHVILEFGGKIESRARFIFGDFSWCEILD